MRQCRSWQVRGRGVEHTVEVLWGAGHSFGHGARDEFETCVVWEGDA